MVEEGSPLVEGDTLEQLKDAKKVTPMQMMQILQNQLTLIEGNAEKERQRVLDQIFELMSKMAQLSNSQGKEIPLLKNEIERLQRLCHEHNIDFSPPKPEPKKEEAKPTPKPEPPAEV